MTGRNAIWTALLVVFLLGGSGDGAKILGLFAFPSKSHMISFLPLLHELARRGHEVTVVSCYPTKNPPANYTDIVIDDLLLKENIDRMFTMEEGKKPSMLTFMAMWYDSNKFCEKVTKQPGIQKLIAATDDLHFDVVIFESIFSECLYGWLYKLKVPVITITPNTVLLMVGDPTGNVHTTSYIPGSVDIYKTPMTFMERLKNTLEVGMFHLVRELVFLPKHDEVARRVFNDSSIPSVSEIEKKSALQIINYHFSISFPRPLTPNTIDVAGMHIKPSEQLPKDLKKFLDESPHGVIYFSLGSNVRSANMPEKMRKGLLAAFSKLKQNVLWKWETDDLPGKPANVRLGKWLPQNDILGHPNVRVFITHGGLMSTQEATYHGLPMLAIPVMGDQIWNARRAQDAGYAITVDLHNITEESISWALNELLNQPSYQEKAKLMSALFKDRPEPPLEKAVYWTEYVIRHKGAPHLRSAALDLYWFQYYLLDVLGVLLAALIAVILTVYYALRGAYRKMCSGEKGKSKVTKSKKRN